MRRPASILALTVAALASIATERALPSGYAVSMEAFTVDPADPEPVVIELNAAWTDDARRRAEMTGGTISLDLTVPDGVIATAASVDGDETVSSEEGWLFASFPAVCDASSCARRVEVAFEGPADMSPFEVEVRTDARVRITEYRDEEDLDVELTLSGPGVP